MDICIDTPEDKTQQWSAMTAIIQIEKWAASIEPRENKKIENALEVLRFVANHRSYPEFLRSYPDDFIVDDEYRQGLPDIQNGPAGLIKGADRKIQHVGISNFRLPVRFRSRDKGVQVLQASVVGTVSLSSGIKGINMSRIMRTFYEYAEKTFSFEVMEGVIDSYKRNLESIDARLQMGFSFPMQVKSLRSGLTGYQYYNVALELAESNRVRNKIMHIDYVYSSTCPCSLELSEDARRRRGQLATPHSQRSVARISIIVDDDEESLWFEDVIEMCRSAVPTETQVMVKREDEQAFAELNAANPIFVEDAARLFSEVLDADPRIGDFRVVASHQESLHSHDAVSVLTNGPTFASDTIDPAFFRSMYHVG